MERVKIVVQDVVETSWARIKDLAKDGAKDGLLKSGNLIPVTLKNGEEIQLVVAHDEFDRVFFVLKDCSTEHKMATPTNAYECVWATSDMRRYLNEEVFPLLPDDLQAVIAPAKIVQIFNDKHFETEDKLFLLSQTQVFGKGYWSNFEPGDAQLDCFTDKKSRMKLMYREKCSLLGNYPWWLRTPNYWGVFRFVTHDGCGQSNDANCEFGVIFAFTL